VCAENTPLKDSLTRLSLPGLSRSKMPKRCAIRQEEDGVCPLLDFCGHGYRVIQLTKLFQRLEVALVASRDGLAHFENSLSGVPDVPEAAVEEADKILEGCTESIEAFVKAINKDMAMPESGEAGPDLTGLGMTNDDRIAEFSNLFWRVNSSVGEIKESLFGVFDAGATEITDLKDDVKDLQADIKGLLVRSKLLRENLPALGENCRVKGDRYLSVSWTQDVCSWAYLDKHLANLMNSVLVESGLYPVGSGGAGTKTTGAANA